MICWPVSERFFIGIQIRTLTGQLHSQTEELIQLDTGYSGEILVPEYLFEILRLRQERLPRATVAQGTTVSGELLDLREAPADVLIPQTGEQHRVIVQTFVGNTRFLIGRAFLRRFKILLDGPGAQTCLMTPTTSTTLHS